MYGQVVKEKGWYKNMASLKLRKEIHHVATVKEVLGGKSISLIELAKVEVGSKIFAITMQDLSKALEIKSEGN